MESSSSRYFAGIDAGSKNLRLVQGTLDKHGKFTVTTFRGDPSKGIRRGAVGELNEFRDSVLDSLTELEKKSGVEVNTCTVGVGSLSLKSIVRQAAVNIPQERNVIEDDVERLKDQVRGGLDASNRAILGIYPFEYVLDNQPGISNPVDMRGVHLEASTSVVSMLSSDFNGFEKALTDLGNAQCVASPMAAAEAVLTKDQRNNGVCVIDFGAETTSLAIYDEGSLQYLAVIGQGSHNITKDLATMLMVIPEVAEEVKLKYASCNFALADPESILDVKLGKENYSFKWIDVNDTVEARLDEIFTQIRKHLKASGYDRRLAEGAILVGGGANMRGICDYAREKLELAIRIGRPNPQAVVVADSLRKPEWATAIGLMMLDEHVSGCQFNMDDRPAKKAKSGGGLLKKLFSVVK